MPSACPRCGTMADEGSQFCENCGASLATPQAPTLPQALVPPQVPGAGAPVPLVPPVSSPPPVSAVPPPVPAVPPPASPVPPALAIVPPTSQQPYYPPAPGAPYPLAGGAVPPGGAGFPPGGGGYYPPPGAYPPSPPHNRLSPLVLFAVITAALVVAVAVGIAVPQLIHHSPTLALPTTTTSRTVTTGSPGVTTTTISPATTVVPVTSISPATTVVPVTSISPASTVPAAATTTTPSGQTASNRVVRVALPSGWTVASSSTSTNLYLGGPDGLFADFTTQTVSSGVTLTQVFENDLSNFQQNSEFTNVSECEQPQSGNVPGTPKEPGAAEVICFTVTPQGGNAVPYAALVANGLVQGSSSQLLLSVVGFAPQGTSSSTLQQDLAPELASAQWLQLSGS